MTSSSPAGDRHHLHVVGQARPERADAARNRRRVLEAAWRITRERGPEALTMDAVAEAAGVGIGTVYRRFGDLAGLAYALIDESEQAFQDAFLHGPPPLGPGAPPRDRLHAYVHAYVDRLDAQAQILAAAQDRRYETGAYRLQQRHLTHLISEIDASLDAEALAAAINELLSGRFFLHQRRIRGMSVERIKAGLDQLLRGITG
ncbi:TetR/AcrR family transcriptional regulator [Haloactinopolyspora sp.]|uniref:TetR/AcrR family transcriptional regulator n=1 Tax=Haloactinopolyspora sp. TaxID=1966353 RepID=UPI00262E8022|nr:TetR/AcrR family transcriptional regulator [Haloactinopolyspora sp.]